MQAAPQIHLKDEMAKLVQHVPEFGDAEKAAKMRDDIVKFGQSEGFSAEELAGLSDHRHILVLRKATLYDEPHSKRDAVTKKAEKAKPFVKASGPKNPLAQAGQSLDRQSLPGMKKSGSVDDVAKFLLS